MSEDFLQLDKQICFPLYASSRLITRMYQPLLDALEITYPQYLILMVLWEQDQIPVKILGQKLFLESNTLTPLLKRMENKDLIQRQRSREDERQVLIHLTKKGRALKAQAACVPIGLLEAVEIKPEQLQKLHQELWALLQLLQQQVETQAA